MSGAPRTTAEWRDHFAERGPGPTLEAWLLRLAAVDAATQRAALTGLADARTLARRFEAAWDGRGRALGGIPFLAKDVFHLAGEPTRAGTTFLAEILEPPAHDSALIRLARDRAGAVACGKTQLNELAFGLSGENPHFGDCPHPREPSRLSGGSSSGSAWAVGAGLVPFALATDTVGSIRVPATHCGVHGLRLPPGPASDDCFPLSPGFDAAGWIAGTAEDLATVTRELLGAPERPAGRGLWLGDPGAGVPPDVLGRQRAAALALGAEDAAETARALRAGLSGAGEAYPVLGGWAAAQTHAAWRESHADRLDPAVLARLRAGAARTPEERAAAERVRERVRAELLGCLAAGWDWIALPCTAGPALPRGRHDAAARRALLELNAPASLAGLGAIAIPVALDDGLTAGIQLVARDLDVLRALAALPGRS